MKIEKIRAISLQYAQRPCLTPEEYRRKKKVESKRRRLAWLRRDPCKAKARYAASYLTSAHWKEFRAAVLLERGRKCEQCGGTSRIQVHHLTYKRCGNERPDDVVVLCRSCHEEIHGRGK